MKVRKLQDPRKDINFQKSKYLYPFFTNSINAKILNVDTVYNELTSTNEYYQNELAKFDKFSIADMTFEDLLDLFPTSEEIAMAQIEIYFDTVHPIIPIVDRSIVVDKLSKIYKQLATRQPVLTCDSVLIMAIFFCSAFSNVAAGIIPDLLLCNRYYSCLLYTSRCV